MERLFTQAFVHSLKQMRPIVRGSEDRDEHIISHLLLYT